MQRTDSTNCTTDTTVQFISNHSKLFLTSKFLENCPYHGLPVVAINGLCLVRILQDLVALATVETSFLSSPPAYFATSIPHCLLACLFLHFAASALSVFQCSTNFVLAPSLLGLYSLWWAHSHLQLCCSLPVTLRGWSPVQVWRHSCGFDLPSPLWFVIQQLCQNQIVLAVSPLSKVLVLSKKMSWICLQSTSSGLTVYLDLGE